jgi:hypothetical protein
MITFIDQDQLEVCSSAAKSSKAARLVQTDMATSYSTVITGIPVQNPLNVFRFSPPHSPSSLYAETMGRPAKEERMSEWSFTDPSRWTTWTFASETR